MACLAKRSRYGYRRQKPVRQAAGNQRWLHLSSGDVSARDNLQTVWGWSTMACCLTTFAIALTAALEGVMDEDSDVRLVYDALEALLTLSLGYTAIAKNLLEFDHILYGIPQDEERQTQRYKRSASLRLNDLSDTQAHKMTHFYHRQLVELYDLFDLEGYLHVIDEEIVPLYTGHYHNGSPCRYMIDPEELFLFTLTKLATGLSNRFIVDEWFGGDYAR